MQIDLTPIRNKQRIYIGGNRGVEQIVDIIKHVLNHIGKPADFYSIGEQPVLTDAPMVFLSNADAIENGSAVFHQLEIHILLLHRIKDKVPAGYNLLDDYVAQYERLADSLPKSGTFIFNMEDNVATLIGKKEREDVRNYEYFMLKKERTERGVAITINDTTIEVPTNRRKFHKRLAGARALLNRIGVSDEQIMSALKSFS